MVNVGPLEILLVAMIALIVLGPARLPEVARSVGRGMREFRSALNSASEDDPPDEDDVSDEEDVDEPVGDEPADDEPEDEPAGDEAYQKDAESSESSSSSSGLV